MRRSSLHLATRLQSQRDCVLQPRVATNELPWVMFACAPQLRRSCAINRNNAMPQSLRMGLIIRGVGATSSRLRGVDVPRFPRVARCSQPWALLQNPFGIPARLPVLQSVQGAAHAGAAISTNGVTRGFASSFRFLRCCARGPAHSGCVFHSFT